MSIGLSKRSLDYYQTRINTVSCAALELAIDTVAQKFLVGREM